MGSTLAAAGLAERIGRGSFGFGGRNLGAKRPSPALRARQIAPAALPRVIPRASPIFDSDWSCPYNSAIMSIMARPPGPR
jgi:hypothetical protein